MGTAEKGPELTPVHLGNWREFIDNFGANPECTLTQEAKRCFQNGVFEVVATRIIGKGGEVASAILKDNAKLDTVGLKARVLGAGGNNIKFSVEKGKADNAVRLLVSDGVVFEVFEDLVMDPSSGRYLIDYVNDDSKLLMAEDLKSKSESPKNVPVLIKEAILKGGKEAGPPSEEPSKQLWRSLRLKLKLILYMLVKSLILRFMRLLRLTAII